MARGGARKGAGRKKGLEAELYRAELLKQIGENKQALAIALVSKGLAGDVPALKEINERSLGKVKESVEVKHSFSLTDLFNKTSESE